MALLFLLGCSQKGYSAPGFDCCCGRRQLIPVTKTKKVLKTIKKTVITTITARKERRALFEPVELVEPAASVVEADTDVQVEAPLEHAPELFARHLCEL